MQDNQCFTLSDASVQDKAIIMCIQRIEQLEEIARVHLVNTITTCSFLDNVALDVFFFLLGIPVTLRTQVISNADMIKYYLHTYLTSERIQSDPRILRMCDMLKSPKRYTDITSDDVLRYEYINCNEVNYNNINGNNLYPFLLTWSYGQLEEYWQYRLQWTQWSVS
jgi:hypothetical protein